MVKGRTTIAALFLFSAFTCRSQLSLSETAIHTGSISEAKEIRGSVVVSNPGAKRVFLMRADADPGVKVHTSKKSLQPSDTALLTISFEPEKAGNFSKLIKLVTSASANPIELTISGTLGKISGNQQMACYDFGRRLHISAKEVPIVVEEQPVTRRDVSNRMETPAEPTVPVQPVQEEIPSSKKQEYPAEDNSPLPRHLYRPNNLLFLLDVSGSMKDSTKLGYMKLALHRLIDQVRDIDSVTLVTYADTVKVLCEAVSGREKEQLHARVQALKPRGVTQGRKAIVLSQQMLQRHYITEGNNEMLIATDGIFKFEKKDQDAWNSRQGDRPVVLGTLAFGQDKEALKNLKSIARRGKGGFVHIARRSDTENKLLEEIKTRSLVGG